MSAVLGRALRNYLLADVEIYAGVGGARVFNRRMPQGEKRPSLVYQRISAVGDHWYGGPSGLGHVRLQIDAWSTDPDVSAALADHVKRRIDGAMGFWPYGTGSPRPTLDVQGVFFAGERDDEDDAAKLFRMSRDYEFHFQEG